MRVRKTGMPRRRASVAQRGHHATGNVVLNTLSQHRLQSRRQKGSLQQLRVQPRTRCKCRDAVIAFSAWLRDEGQSSSSCKDHLDAVRISGVALARRSTCRLCRRGNQWLTSFLAKETLFPSCVGIAPHLEAGGAPFAGSSAHLANCFVLMATALAWNLTDVAVLIAIGYGGFVRTMEALTLQRSQITAHSSCVLLTLPIPKTGERTGKTQSVSIDDLLLVFIIIRWLCMLSPSDYLLQRSSHSFRTIFTGLLGALELGSFHFSPYSLRRRGGATAPLDAFFETWRRPLRKVAGPLGRPHAST